MCDSFPAVQHEDRRSPASSPAAVATPRCVRCNQQVATVDRILISGVLLHRACLSCSRCGITLRLSEVRDGAGDDVCNFNYLCILCSKNRVNIANKQSDRMTTSLDGRLLATRPPPAPISPNQQRRQAAAEKSAAVSSFAATDEYELRLRERMKWKEQFLLNNNNIDFGPLVKREVFKTSSAGLSESNHLSDESTPASHFDNQSKACLETAAGTAVLSETTNAVTSSVPESRPGGDPAVPPSRNRHKINERIEYENVSNSFELYDDDELTKMLNLEPEDQWESGDEEEESTSSGSWRRSEDSTDADFDSDEFDLSNASKQAERKRQEARKRKQEAEQEALVVPEIVVQETDEDGGATSEEIDTAVLDTAGGFSLPLHESSLDQISESDSLDAQHVGAGLLASASLSKRENSAQNTCSNSDSDSGESHTLADVTGKRGLLASCSHSRSPDSRSISKKEDDDDTANTSVSSLSCCDVSGAFEDLNLLSLLDEETTAGGSASIDAAERKGLAAGSTASSLLTSNSITSVAVMQTGDVTASPAPASVRMTPTTNNNTHSNRTNAESSAASSASSTTLLMQSHTPSSTGRQLLYSSSKDLLLGDNLSSSTASSSNINSLSSKSTTASNCNTGSTSGSMRATSFKVAQPKFTVFNFEFQLPPVSTGSCLSSTVSVKAPAHLLTCGRKPDAVPESVIKSELSFVPSRGSASGGLTGSGPPTHQDHETYSKIPVLATRVNESNQSPKGKPSYSGSFTEKLMLRCRSSPTLVGKENLKSADGSGSGTGAAYQSVLAKWACNNLFQMERSSSPATYSVMDLLSRSRSNDTGSRNSSVNSDHADPQ